MTKTKTTKADAPKRPRGGRKHLRESETLIIREALCRLRDPEDVAADARRDQVRHDCEARACDVAGAHARLLENQCYCVAGVAK